MVWQAQGDYLAVVVERWNKTKRHTYNDLAVFHMREKLIPCDHLDVKEKILSFSFEPNGNKFFVIHGESPRIGATLYQIQDTGVSCKGEGVDLNNNKITNHTPLTPFQCTDCAAAHAGEGVGQRRVLEPDRALLRAGRPRQPQRFVYVLSLVGGRAAYRNAVK